MSHMADSHLSRPRGESSNMVPTFTENWRLAIASRGRKKSAQESMRALRECRRKQDIRVKRVPLNPLYRKEKGRWEFDYCFHGDTGCEKIVPPSASSKRPSPLCTAPVKAPFSWPNSSEEISDSANAAQFRLMKARPALRDRLWTARAMSSLPVPVSPVMRTVESLGATLATWERTARKAEDVPTISSNIEVSSISSR
jgi:hypothetical protein